GSLRLRVASAYVYAAPLPLRRRVGLRRPLPRPRARGLRARGLRPAQARPPARLRRPPLRDPLWVPLALPPARLPALGGGLPADPALDRSGRLRADRPRPPRAAPRHQGPPGSPLRSRAGQPCWTAVLDSRTGQPHAAIDAGERGAGHRGAGHRGAGHLRWGQAEEGEQGPRGARSTG